MHNSQAWNEINAQPLSPAPASRTISPQGDEPVSQHTVSLIMNMFVQLSIAVNDLVSQMPKFGLIASEDKHVINFDTIHVTLHKQS